MLFSATMPGEVVTLARRHLHQPLHVRAEQEHDEPEVVPLTDQHVFRAHQMDKIEMLARILQARGRGLTMVFGRTKRSADQGRGAEDPASPPPRCTVTWPRARGNTPCARSATGRWTCWSPRTSRPAGSTSRA